MELVIHKPIGESYRVNGKGEIYRDGMQPSGKWLMRGIRHVRRAEFIPFSKLTPELVSSLTLRFKNGKPQWTVADLEHGTPRTWGNTAYHGIASITFEEEPCVS